MKEQVLKEFTEWIKKQSTQMSIIWEKRAAAYIRVSTDKQTELSPISQLKEIYKYAITNELYLDLNYVFIEDEGISAKGSKIDKRTEFNNMIALAKSKDKPFDAIIVWKFSRFARNQEQSILFKNLLRKEHKIDIKSVSEPVIDGPFGELIERIIEWFDEYYLINLSQEVRRGMTENANKGKFQSAAPFGYRMREGQLVIQEDEANIVKLIYNKFIKDEMTMMDLAKYINKLGFKTKRGGSFENRTINYILLNPIYKGYSRWTPDGRLSREEMYNNTKSIIKKSNHEPIIDEEAWNLATQKLEKYRTYRKPHQRDVSNPWSWIKGLIRCKNCGKTFIRTSGKLRCNGYNKGACTCCDTLIAEEVEELVLEQIKYYFEKPVEINIEKTIKKQDEVSEKDIILKKLDFIAIKEERVKNAYINGIDSIEEYKHNKAILVKEKNSLLDELNNIKEEKEESCELTIKEHLHNAYELLTDSSIDMNRKHSVAHELINRIEYENATLTLFFNEI